jgi:hypothetical protein
MDTQDIALENFLMGDKKQWFLNIEKLDVVELRALALVLPLKFELDGDNKKKVYVCIYLYIYMHIY